MKNGRRLVALVLAILMVMGLAAAASAETTKTAKIGILQYVEHNALDASVQGFKDVLLENGYTEDCFTYMNASGDNATLQMMAGDYASGYDLVLAVATPAVQAVSAVTDETPVLGTAVTDYVSANLVMSNEKPGANVSGTSDMNPIEEQIDLLMQLAPETKTIGTEYTATPVTTYQSKDLTVDSIVEGGQTMNPSIEDLAAAVEKAHAKTVFVLPNNGNVILAAQQAARLCDGKKVVVIPTKNVAMGIAAAIAFQPEASVEENAAAMEEAAQRVRTGTVTYAVRDTDIDDLHINEGDIIGLYNGAIHTVGNNIHDVTRDLMKEIVTEDDELITVYYGKDTAEEDAQRLTDELAEMYGDCDVEVQMGGQPLYYYLVSVE